MMMIWTGTSTEASIENESTLFIVMFITFVSFSIKIGKFPIVKDQCTNNPCTGVCSVGATERHLLNKGF